ncbi:MAG: hypothetical protein K8W52_34040 [Deltaproteobacteria bacterium]|nr:hypothetical protein [Deltaproteobacteria bacterium]
MIALVIQEDRALGAQIVARRPLRYRGGADAALDRPAHVRAASALVALGARLIVAQDDASFLGVIEPATGLVDDIPLPAAEGVRQFGAARGNKAAKLDLEAALALDDRLIAFGSGGPLAARQVMVAWTPGAAPVVLTRPRWFAAIAAAVLPAGAALNLEGAALVGGEVWLVNRGGDVGDEGARSPDAIARWPVAELERCLADDAYAPPVPAITMLALGDIEGCDLHVTDLAHHGGALVLAAAAEATTSFYDDGAVRGAAIAVLGPRPRWARVTDERGAPSVDKIEGLASIDGRLFGVVDADEPDHPADLLELALTGPWFA